MFCRNGQNPPPYTLLMIVQQSIEISAGQPLGGVMIHHISTELVATKIKYTELVVASAELVKSVVKPWEIK